MKLNNCTDIPRDFRFGFHESVSMPSGFSGSSKVNIKEMFLGKVLSKTVDKKN